VVLRVWRPRRGWPGSQVRQFLQTSRGARPRWIACRGDAPICPPRGAPHAAPAWSPEWPPVQRSGAGHGTPDGPGAARHLGREGRTSGAGAPDPTGEVPPRDPLRVRGVAGESGNLAVLNARGA
jgi:hypothetical protein